GTILVICGAGPRVNTKIFVAQAQTHGFQTEVLSAPVRTAAYDAAVMLHQLQTAQNPQDLLADVHAALRPGAPLLVTVPCVDSWPARFFGRQWTEWRPENRWYFAQSSIQSLLLRQGFAGVLLNPDRRVHPSSHSPPCCRLPSHCAYAHDLPRLSRPAAGPGNAEPAGRFRHSRYGAASRTIFAPEVLDHCSGIQREPLIPRRNRRIAAKGSPGRRSRDHYCRKQFNRRYPRTGETICR